MSNSGVVVKVNIIRVHGFVNHILKGDQLYWLKLVKREVDECESKNGFQSSTPLAEMGARRCIT